MPPSASCNRETISKVRFLDKVASLESSENDVALYVFVFCEMLDRISMKVEEYFSPSIPDYHLIIQQEVSYRVRTNRTFSSLSFKSHVLRMIPSFTPNLQACLSVLQILVCFHVCTWWSICGNEEK